jgi:DNA-binding beta-propeller fold protein YncE
MSASLKGNFALAFYCLCSLALPASTALGQSVVATIPVLSYAGAGAVDAVAEKAYIPVASENAPTEGGQVTIINEKTNTIDGVITVNSLYPTTSIALNPVDGLLYVGAESGGLFIVDSRTRNTRSFINVNAASVAVDPLTDKIYASDFESNLFVIDGVTNTIVKTIPLNGIQNVAVNPVTNRVYAAIGGIPGSVAVIDGNTNSVITQVRAGSGLSFDVAVDPLRNVFYSTEQFGTLTVYNGATNTVTKVVPVPGQPDGLSFDPITRALYVSNITANTLYIISGETNQATGSLPLSQPAYSTYDPFHKLLYVGTSTTAPNGYPASTLSVVSTK